MTHTHIVHQLAGRHADITEVDAHLLRVGEVYRHLSLGLLRVEDGPLKQVLTSLQQASCAAGRDL